MHEKYQTNINHFKVLLMICIIKMDHFLSLNCPIDVVNSVSPLEAMSFSFESYELAKDAGNEEDCDGWISFDVDDLNLSKILGNHCDVVVVFIMAFVGSTVIWYPRAPKSTNVDKQFRSRIESYDYIYSRIFYIWLLNYS